MQDFIDAVTYGRNSDLSQKTSQAIQDDAFGHFAVNGFKDLLKSPARIVENYKDHGKSASKKKQLDKRHDFHRMLDDVRAGVIRKTGEKFPGIIIILNTSRFSRLHPMDTLSLYNVLREHGVKLVIIDDRKVIDFTDDCENFMLYFKAKEDREYARTLAKNTLRGNVRAARLGRCHQRFPPYGMMKLVITDKGQEFLYARQESFNKPKEWKSYLIPGDAVEQEVVNAMFMLFHQRDVSFIEVAREFNLHPNLKYRLGPTGNGWHEQTIKHILTNLHYAGYEFIGIETTGEHFRFCGEEVIEAKDFSESNPLIVDILEIGHPKQGIVVNRELFQKVQAKIKRKAERGSKPKSTVKNPEGYSLTGVLICGNCGKPLYGHHNKGNPIYACLNAKRGLCQYWSVKEGVILPWIITTIDKKVWEQLADKPIIPADEPDDGLQDDIARLDRKINVLKGKLAGTDDADLTAALADTLGDTLKAKKELESQASQTDRIDRIRAAHERWEVFIQPMLIPVKTGTVGEGQEALMEQMGIPQWEVDRLFNYTLVRRSAVRETLLSFNAEVKLWFMEKQQGQRASGKRKAWDVDFGKMTATIGGVPVTKDNLLAGEL